MKLSEMNTKELSRALCQLAGPLEKIGSDDSITKMFKDMSNKKGQISKLQEASKMVGTIIPVLLEKHQADTFTALSILTGKSVQEIETQNGMQTVRDLKGVLDKDLLDFFTPST